MAQIVPVIIEPIISSTANKVVEVDVAKDEDEFDLDSDDDHDHDHVMMDLEGIDEQVAAIHALGNLCLYCSGLMQPHLQRISEAMLNIGQYVHENVRYHTCLTLTQIAIGMMRLAKGMQDSDDKFEWTAGIPV